MARSENPLPVCELPRQDVSLVKVAKFTRLGFLLIVVLTLAMLLWSGPGFSHVAVLAQSGSGWSEPVMVSTNTVKSWFPDIAVDTQGHSHIVWHAERREDQELLDLLMYATGDGEVYLEPNDIVFPGVGGFTIRPAIAADDKGKLHVTYRDGTEICYIQAPSDIAWNTFSWTPRKCISGAGTGSAYYSDVSVDEDGGIHVVWNEGVPAGVVERWLWVGTPAGNTLYDGYGWRSQEPRTGLADRAVYAMIEDGAGVQWFGTDEGVYRFDGATWQRFTTRDGLAAQRVNCISDDLDGRLWFGTDNGVSVYDEELRRDQWTLYTARAGLPDDAVHAIARDGWGAMWVGTGKGLARYDEQNWTSYTPEDGLVAADVLAVAVDSQGDVWAGTRQGVSRFDRQRWMTYTVENGLISNVVTAIVTDREGMVWFGTDKGLSQFDGQGWTFYPPGEGLVGGAVTALAVDSRGSIWVGTEQGLSRYDGRTWERFELPQEFAGQAITAIAGDRRVNAMCNSCADVFYRHSYDGGETWSAPINLSSSFAGSVKPQVRVSGGGNVYVNWEEGEDWYLHQGYPVASMYVCSSDRGNAWAEPTVFTSSLGAPQQITLGIGPENESVVVWRLPETDAFYYQHSKDNGDTWSAPEPIRGVIAKPWDPFSLDGYDMVTDSAGQVHLVVLGRIASLEEDLGVIHLVWDGSEWSAPARIFASSDPPEWPRIDVGLGNKVYVTWFTRDERHINDPERGRYKVWVSSYEADAPGQAPVPLPTRSPTPASVDQEQGSSAFSPATTPIPTIAQGTSGLPPGLYTENDELAGLLVALSPTGVVWLVVVALRFRRRKRRG